MSQNPLVLPTSGTVSGLQMTEDTNAALDTLNTLASGPSAPSSAEAGQLWHDTTNNILRIRSLDNTSWITLFTLNETSYVATPPSSGGSSSFSVNRILNGAMLVDQVNEGSSYSISSGGNSYTLDQWQIGLQTSSFSGVSAIRSSDAPAGFTQSLKVTVATATGSPASTDELAIIQPVEGYNISDWDFGSSNASSFSLSFWVKSSVTGTFAASLQNGSNNRSLVNSFTIGAANTWQQVNFSNIPGDVAGTWNNTNGVGLEVAVTLAAGTTLQTSTLGTWQSGKYFASTSQSNSPVLTSGSTFQLTGVMINSGAFCAPFEKRIYSQDFAMLQRYFEKTMPQGVAAKQNAGFNGVAADLVTSISASANLGLHSFKATKRSTPSVTFFCPNASSSNGIDSNGLSVGSLTTQYTADGSFSVIGDTSNSTIGAAVFYHWIANARM